MLHLVKNSPFNSDNLALCLAFLNKNDAILLFEDAVIAGIGKQIWSKKLQQTNALVFLLEEDIVARSFFDKISPQFNLVDMHGFVELTEKHQTIISW